MLRDDIAGIIDDACGGGLIARNCGEDCYNKADEILSLIKLQLPECPYHYPQYVQKNAFNEAILKVKELNEEVL